MKYHFITQNENAWPLALQCRVLGVSRSGYYNFRKGAANGPDPGHQTMLERVRQIHRSTGGTYGSRRMKQALRDAGYLVSRNKARNLMKEANISARRRRKYKVTTNSGHEYPVFENQLNRDFQVTDVNRVYAGDITYIWTQEGWLYLAVVIDLCSRMVVGWSMSTRMKGQLVCDALQMALWRRRPSTGLIHHSDRGSQYASKQFRRLLKAYGITGSMSRKGDCWDNAVVESFFGSLKQERVQWRNYQTRKEAQKDILNYIAVFYNNDRLHSYLGYLSPKEYERRLLKKQNIA